jgi:geranylgeranyl diphosphate synthase type II
MSHELDRLLLEGTRALESELDRWLPASTLDRSEGLNRAVRYSVFPGGKRMRPLFTLLAAHAAGGSWRDALPVACAVEYIHTCSLILDDLPCMDRASERRGRRPTYAEFGESTAILAAVALLNRSWSLLLCGDGGQGIGRTRRLVEEAGCCIGPDGLIGGQFLDLAGRGDTRDSAPDLLKTAGATRFMLSAGAIVAGAPEPVVEALGAFGREIGAAYQMLDDVIDREADARTGAARAGAPMVDLACDRLHGCADSLVHGCVGAGALLLLEYTHLVFRPLIDRARECPWPGIAGVRTP